MHEQSRRIYSADGLSPTIHTMQGGNTEVKVAVDKINKEKINVMGNYMPSGHDASRIVHPEGLAPTVKENHGTVTATVVPHHKPFVVNDITIHDEKMTLNENLQRNFETLHNLHIRKLTPKECWRLMGFDDSDFEKAEKVCSNTQLYKQAGNSIVVNVLEGILGALLPKQTRSEWLDELLGV